MLPGPASLALLVAAPFFGSFLGVLVARLPQRRGVLAGRSRCDACDATLGARDLIPVLGWLTNRGRCRRCGARIDLVYPGIELAALAIAAWSLAVLPGWLALAGSGLGWVLMTLAVIDWRAGILPDALTLPLLGAGLVVAWAIDPTRLPAHVAGAAAGFLALWGIGAVYRRLRGREGLGTGDAVLLAACGAWVSWEGLPSVLLIGAVGGLVAALLRARQEPRLSGATALPFGPFLALGAWLVWLYGPLTIRIAG